MFIARWLLIAHVLKEYAHICDRRKRKLFTSFKLAASFGKVLDYCNIDANGVFTIDRR